MSESAHTHTIIGNASPCLVLTALGTSTVGYPDCKRWRQDVKGQVKGERRIFFAHVVGLVTLVNRFRLFFCALAPSGGQLVSGSSGGCLGRFLLLFLLEFSQSLHVHVASRAPLAAGDASQSRRGRHQHHRRL